MSSSNLVSVRLLEEVSYGITPAEVAAFKVRQDLTYTADVDGETGNLISITYTGAAVAGSEVVTVVGKAITVQIQSGVSTATQIKAAVDASVAASALISVAITGTGSNTQVTASAAFLAGGIGDFNTVRFTNEKLSGTPGTTESQQIRVDRFSSGQILTSLAVGGDISFELARESMIDRLIASGMLSNWTSFSPVTVNLTIDVSAKTITRSSGAWPATLLQGDVITLSGFTNTENNVPVMATSIVSTTVIDFVGAEDMVSEVATGTSFVQNDKISIGVTKKSFVIEKAFTDLTTKAIFYNGMLVSNFSLSVAYGAIVTGSFGFSGNGYEVVDAAADFVTYNRNIQPAATTDSMNGSVDMPFIATSAIGSLDRAGFCIQKVDLSVDNQFITQNCIGVPAPTGYSPGTAKVEVSLGAYLSDTDWGILAKKLDQSSFAIGFMLKNAGGWYAFYMPAVQVSFPDPASGGANQDISLDMKGMAKVGDNGESPLTIFRS